MWTFKNSPLPKKGLNGIGLIVLLSFSGKIQRPESVGGIPFSKQARELRENQDRLLQFSKSFYRRARVHRVQQLYCQVRKLFHLRYSVSMLPGELKAGFWRKWKGDSGEFCRGGPAMTSPSRQRI